MKTNLYQSIDAQAIIKSIKVNTTFVNWRTKQKYSADFLKLCDVCNGPVVAGRDVSLRLYDGGRACKQCVECGIDLGFKLT